MPTIYELVSTYIMAGFKYMVAVMMSFGFDLGMGFSILVCTLGGITGVSVYLLFGKLIYSFFQKYFTKKKPGQIPINRRTRWVVKIKNHHGLLGIAILTPVFLSVPVGTLAAVGIGYSWQRVLLYMAGAFLAWSLFFFGLYEISGLKVNDLIERIFQ